MLGAPFLLPLYADAGDAAAADAPDALHPLPARPQAEGACLEGQNARLAPQKFDVDRVARLLRGVAVCGSLPEAMAAEMDEEAVRRLPDWARAVAETGAFADAVQEVTPSNKKQTRSSRKRSLSPPEVSVGGGNASKRIRVKTEALPKGAQSNETDGYSGEAPEDIEDECPPRTLFTNEERVAGSVEKYSEMIEKMLEIMADRQQIETASGRVKFGLFERTEVRALFQSLRVMSKGDLIRKADPQLIISLMGLLDKQVQYGLSIDVLASTLENPEESGSHQTFGLDAQLLTSLDVGLCQLIIMSTPEIDRRALSDETIDNCIQLLNQTLSDKPADLSKKAAGSAQRGLSQHRVNLRENKTLRNILERIVPLVCEFMEHVARLLLSVKLADRWVLHFSSSMVEFFMVEHSSFAISLQQGGLMVLRSIFMNYKDHRALVMEEIVSAMMKLPTAKRGLRTVKLLNSNGFIQRISILAVSMVQSSASVPDLTLLDDTAKSIDASNIDQQGETLSPIRDAPSLLAAELNALSTRTLEDARENARLLIGPLMKECFKKNEERDNRLVLDNFVEDILIMFMRPEWSGAEIILEVLSSTFASILSGNLSKETSKVESQHSLSALNLVGKICTAIKIQQNAAAQDPFVDDADVQATIADYAKVLVEDGILLETNLDKITQELILKHIVVIYLHRTSRTDNVQLDSLHLLLMRFITESFGAHAAEVVDAHLKHWRSFWGVSEASIGRKSKAAPPTTELGLRFSQQLVVTRDLCQMFAKLLAHIMALLSHNIPSFRARVMKVLAGIVDVDPMLMAEGGVRSAVQRCFLDERTSVRQAAVELVGKYVMVQPSLFDNYFDMLVDRLRDRGVSVRKSVCKIFRSFLTLLSLHKREDSSGGDVRRRSSCMRSLVERIGDPVEEQMVKNYIIDTFQDVWFGDALSSRQLLIPIDSFAVEHSDEPPPGWTPIKANHEHLSSPEHRSTRQTPSSTPGFLSPNGQAVSSIDEAWSAYRQPVVTPSTVAKQKRSKIDDSSEVTTIIIEVIHDMSSLEWFVSLLKRLLQDTDIAKDAANSASGRVPRDRTAEVKVARKRSEKLVSCLVERLLLLEEGTSVPDVSVTSVEEQFVACMKALASFCEAYPPLLFPHLDHMALYLKGDDSISKSAEVKVQGLAISILIHVFEGMKRITQRIETRVSSDLNQLVLRAPPSVVGPSVKCLATIVRCTGKPPNLLLKLLDMFYAFMVKYVDVETLSTTPPEIQPKLQRALFTAGQIAGAIDFDAYATLANGSRTLTIGNVAESLYMTYSKFIQIPGNAECSAKAVQGLGFLFTLRPRLFLQAQQSGILEALLTTSPDEMKLQCLVSLNGLLETEQKRIEGAATTRKQYKSKTKNDVSGDQEADAALIGSIMQAQLTNVLCLMRSKIARIRTEATGCIANLLTQGLISPIHCIPTLVALETDRVSAIRDIAHAQLLALHEKFPTLLYTPTVQGISMSYSFQLSVFGGIVASHAMSGPPTVWSVDKDKKPYCLFGRLYNSCIRGVRTHRTIFLKALVNQFTHTGSVLKAVDVSAAPAASVAAMPTLGYLCYLAQLISALPFEVDDEPLFIIYLINRYISLKLSSSLDQLKKCFVDGGVFDGIPDDEDPEEADIEIGEKLTAAEMSNKQLTKLHTRGCVAFAVGLLLRLKFALKDMYSLDSERCQTYHPTGASNGSDDAVSVPERMRRPKLPTLDEFECSDPVELYWRVFLLTLRVAREDHQQMDLESAALHPPPKPTPRKKRGAPAPAARAAARRRKSLPAPPRPKRRCRTRSSKAAQSSDEPDEDEEDDEGVDGEEV